MPNDRPESVFGRTGNGGRWTHVYFTLCDPIRHGRPHCSTFPWNTDDVLRPDGNCQLSMPQYEPTLKCKFTAPLSLGNSALTDKSVWSMLCLMDQTETSPRDRVVAAALRLFYEQGYRATGVNQIIAESNVAKATFYSHFPSKEKLCVAYLQARHGVWMGWLQESVEGHSSASARLLGVFDFISEWMVRCDFRGCAFLNIASEVPLMDSEIRGEVVKHKDSLRRYLGKLLAELEDSGTILPGADIGHLVDILYVLAEGAIVGSQNYGEVWPVDAARQAAARLLNL
jgi:AcrR family transcriptional regulator